MNGAAIEIGWEPGADVAPLRDREWLVTNGLGGFASGTLLGVPTRRYHGLFVPNLVEPKGRYILVSRLDEEIDCGDTRCRLGGAEYPDGRVDTDTQFHLRAFRFERQMPTWLFAVGHRLIEKTIVMPHGQNTVCVAYRLVSGEAVRMRLRPYATFRRQDAPLRHGEEWPFELSVRRRRMELRLPDGAPLTVRFGLRPDRGIFVCDERESRDALLRVERDRGYDHLETHYSPGYVEADLAPGEPLAFVATSEGWETLDIDAHHAITAQCHRVDRLIETAAPAAREGFGAQLAAAADAFVVLPGSRLDEAMRVSAAGDELRTIIAGYHWFGDWGRDTMISLEGLTLVTGRHREAAAILRTFSRYVKDGLLPNLFPEGERAALYHTADATLWYFHAIDRYTRVTGDRELLHDLFPVLESIVAHHVGGTRFGIGVDERDGLLHAGAEGYQLTWMDAKVDGWVVTPRRGKPVEIQALWHNALALMCEWSGMLGRDGSGYAARAAKVRESFNARFWNPQAGFLRDVIDGPEGDDPSGRPNQIFALALAHPVLDERHWREVLGWVESRLLTPYGLRTLDPANPDYKRNYHGDLRTRDAAYHQGTVWPWLVGHFVDAWLRVHGDRERARSMLLAFPGHLADAGIGSISEIFDAEPPYVPRGCIAQAWSIAEVLRAWVTTNPPPSRPPSPPPHGPSTAGGGGNERVGGRANRTE